MTGSQSTKTGVAPAAETASGVAKKVLAGTMTSSPAPTPHAIKARWSAAVPFETPTHSRAPTYSANSRSNASTAGPRMKADVSSTRWMAASTSAFIERY